MNKTCLLPTIACYYYTISNYSLEEEVLNLYMKHGVQYRWLMAPIFTENLKHSCCGALCLSVSLVFLPAVDEYSASSGPWSFFNLS